jgi:predicted dehydrogenase
MAATARNDRADWRRTSRRIFLEQSSAVLAGTALSGAIAARAYAAGDEAIKVALIGCGGRGTGAACQILSTKGPVKLWAMAAVFAHRLESSHAAVTKGQRAAYDRAAHRGFGARIDVPPERRFVGFDAYKKAIESGVDLVLLTTPPHFRPVQFEYAVRQGKHVFMEKPVATDAPGIRQLLAANEEARKKNLKVVVGLQRRHDPRYQETIKRIKDGAIGDVVCMRSYWNMGSIRGGRPQPDVTEMQYQLRNWPCFTWLGGDHIVEAHIHNLDVCNWLKGAHPVAAQGQGGRQVHTAREYGDIYDHHFVEFTYQDGTKMFGQCRNISGCWSRVSEHAHGTKGYAEINRARIEGAGKWRFRGRISNPYQREHDVLLDAIRNSKPHNEAGYGAISTMTAIMGRMATYSGKVVRWEDAINSEFSLAPERYAWDAEPPVVPGKDGSYPVAIPGITKAL